MDGRQSKSHHLSFGSIAPTKLIKFQPIAKNSRELCLNNHWIQIAGPIIVRCEFQLPQIQITMLSICEETDHFSYSFSVIFQVYANFGQSVIRNKRNNAHIPRTKTLWVNQNSTVNLQGTNDHLHNFVSFNYAEVHKNHNANIQTIFLWNRHRNLHVTNLYAMSVSGETVVLTHGPGCV